MMNLKDWEKSNEYSHYLALKKQDIANRNTIRNLQLQIKKLKQVKNNDCIADVVGSDLLNDLLKHEEEVLSSPLRFNGVHVWKIRQVFAEHGIIYKPPF